MKHLIKIIAILFSTLGLAYLSINTKLWIEFSDSLFHTKEYGLIAFNIANMLLIVGVVIWITNRKDVKEIKRRRLLVLLVIILSIVLFFPAFFKNYLDIKDYITGNITTFKSPIIDVSTVYKNNAKVGKMKYYKLQFLNGETINVEHYFLNDSIFIDETFQIKYTKTLKHVIDIRPLGRIKEDM